MSIVVHHHFKSGNCFVKALLGFCLIDPFEYQVNHKEIKTEP